MEYEKLCGVRHGGNMKAIDDNRLLKSQEDIAKELGIEDCPLVVQLFICIYLVM
ncbi:hypothetical protein [Clostridium felsineum]|nr:hypothetical protein [Clostridium felsineum]